MSKRQNKISCDISEDAKTMLSSYGLKHERSQGWLIDKMIRRYCSEIEVTAPVVKVPISKKVIKRFVPPTVAEVTAYMFKVTNTQNFGEAGRFVDYYESNGWKVGKNKMKSWNASVRNWLNNRKPKQQGTKRFSDVTNQNINNIGEWLNE